MSSNAGVRPIFSPKPCTQDTSNETNVIPALSSQWLPLLSCPADFPLELFEIAISQLIHHPEYNSTLILRSETISEWTVHPNPSSPPSPFPPKIPHIPGLHPISNVHRKLLPRRPGRDAPLEQNCTLYGYDEGEHADVPCTLVLTPLGDPSSLPYYHPAVSHLAFRYISHTKFGALGNTVVDTDRPGNILQIEVTPLPNVPTDPGSRLYRTSLALLDTLHRYGWGALTNYQKRVQHDCIVPREIYQDVYLLMRARHKHLVDEWREATDPLKHVFEDIGIATFLMLLWKEMYADDNTATSSTKDNIPNGNATVVPWSTWPRPPGGFIDLGCGNGLLTHILTAEGYTGHGFDLRARTSWAHYPLATQAALLLGHLPPSVSSPISDPHKFDFPLNAFLIGNHADELTPWIPVLATLTRSSGYISIPCCAWTFDERFSRSGGSEWFIPADNVDFISSLNLGGGSTKSAYSSYRIWLARLSEWVGWRVECETLRIPSTRNWALVGRTRTGDGDSAHARASAIVASVVRRGAFKTRKPEGKAGDH
ncbi:hypothetical protein BJ138DRAFT_1012903 [Hygrophoropsis aurantiaca]|uniref:Uncharacterized protein n=1 Tax=Hygrophoropsis aurantiaca TaxID=72124 RepID=A0ACB8A592_9AGAM|nr:hypothetical protein BJ138DRAFT_1012903 [Hygrophoropsis aurantiaca]